MTNEAVTVAKRVRKDREDGGIQEVASGVRVRIHSVPQSILQDALQLVQRPQVPMWKNPQKEDREEPNPNDPTYVQAVEQYNLSQFRVTFDVYALLGIELVDGVPEDDGWLKKLQLLERLGRLDLSRFDFTDPIDREFVYKRYVALTDEEYVKIGMASGLNPEGVRAAAENMFPGQ